MVRKAGIRLIQGSTGISKINVLCNLPRVKVRLRLLDSKLSIVQQLEPRSKTALVI